ncbi:unnamed protein product [Rodentolepis nana]|uniref:C2H2-type domain-containing protein n=1 Tax=Rodentolepis nana TaxID=102285 RepID=A0A0R3T055_RODNA|nr:unnamed protein product [Rodentolepis nana]
MKSTCEECRKAYARSTDRAKCMVKDGQQRDSVEQSINCDDISGKKAATKMPIFPVNGPHVCPLCPDKRSYKFDSSLRKHLRLYHPNYKRRTSAATQHLSEQEGEGRRVEIARDESEKTDVLLAIIWGILVLMYPILILAVSAVIAIGFWQLLRAERRQSEEEGRMPLTNYAVDETVLTNDADTGRAKIVSALHVRNLFDIFLEEICARILEFVANYGMKIYNFYCWAVGVYLLSGIKIIAPRATSTFDDQPSRKIVVTPSSNDTCVVKYSLKTSEMGVTSVPTTVAQLPISVNAPTTAYLLPSGELVFTVDTQYAQGDQYYHVVEADESGDQRQSLCTEAETAGTSSTATGLGDVEEWRTSQSAHEAVVGYAMPTDAPNTIHQTHCLPVDLCTSALCLTVTDPSANSTSQQPNVITVDPTTYQTIPSGVGDESALDLTELPHEVIDLSSQGNPVDLSGTHPHQPRSELWESESLFSYTHFLNVDDGL